MTRELNNARAKCGNPGSVGRVCNTTHPGHRAGVSRTVLYCAVRAVPCCVELCAVHGGGRWERALPCRVHGCCRPAISWCAVAVTRL